MIQFNKVSTTSNFIKQLLNTTYLPVIRTVRPGDYIIKGRLYILKCTLLRCTKSGYISITDVYTQDECARYEVVGEYFFGQKNDKLCSNFHSNCEGYDSITHERLGQYLRSLRDMYELNLMPLYNCFSNNIFPNHHVFNNKILKTTDEYHTKIYKIPIRFNTDYNIFIENVGQTTIAPAFINNDNLVKLGKNNTNTTTDITNDYISVHTSDVISTYSGLNFYNPINIRFNNIPEKIINKKIITSADSKNNFNEIDVSKYFIPTSVAQLKDTTIDLYKTADSQIGGRNLLRNSNFASGHDFYVVENGAAKFDSNAYAELTGYRFYNNTGLAVTDQSFTDEKTPVSLSFDVRLPDGKTESILTFGWFGGLARSKKITVASTSWTRVKFEDVRASTVAISFAVNSGDPVQITRIKLEIGTKCTDWTPAPEDKVSLDEKFILTKDTEIQAGKIYFVKSGNDYKKVETPLQGSLSTYYEYNPNTYYLIDVNPKQLGWRENKDISIKNNDGTTTTIHGAYPLTDDIKFDSTKKYYELLVSKQINEQIYNITEQHCNTYDSVEDSLYMLIQVPDTFDSNIVVLEGDYRNRQSVKIFNDTDLQYLPENILDNFFIHNLKLPRMNTKEFIPFSDTLVQFLLWSAICNLDTINLDFDRLYNTMYTTNLFTTGMRYANYWNYRYRQIISNFAHDNGYEYIEDNIGYLTSDIESAMNGFNKYGY